MFKLFDMNEKNKFSWDSIGSISNGRKNLGEDMPVLVYRLFQYSIKDELNKQFGKEKSVEIFRNAGKLAGIEFAHNMLNLNLQLNDFIKHLQEILENSKIGILRIEKLDKETGDAVFTISEDIDCAGLTITGETVCNYDEGFLAGILREFTNKDYIVTEIDCWTTGSRVCRFEARIMKEGID